MTRQTKSHSKRYTHTRADLAAWMMATTLLCMAACEIKREPFTAEMRFEVDSVSSARIRALRTEIDSIYTAQQETRLPQLVDSFYQLRKAQMEAKLQEFKAGQ